MPAIFKSFSANFKCFIFELVFRACPINSPPAVVITLSCNFNVSILLFERINYAICLAPSKPSAFFLILPSKIPRSKDLNV